MKKLQLKELIKEVIEEIDQAKPMDQDWFKGQKMIKDEIGRAHV